MVLSGDVSQLQNLQNLQGLAALAAMATNPSECLYSQELIKCLRRTFPIEHLLINRWNVWYMTLEWLKSDNCNYQWANIISIPNSWGVASYVCSGIHYCVIGSCETAFSSVILGYCVFPDLNLSQMNTQNLAALQQLAAGVNTPTSSSLPGVMNNTGELTNQFSLW